MRFLASFLLGTSALFAATPHVKPKLPFEVFRTSLRFEPNGVAGYVAEGLGYHLVIDRSGLAMNWGLGSEHRGTAHMKLAGANPAAHIEGVDPAQARSNYFLGKPSSWRSGVQQYGRVRIAEVYRGIDLVFYGSEGSLEFDFDVAPGSDPRTIQLEIEGAATPTIEDGSLVLRSDAGTVRWSKPVIYQSTNGVRHNIEGRFISHDAGRVGFHVGPYDRTRPLVIDPVLSFSSYLGNIGNEATRGVAVDSAGNIYVAGYTTSRNLPVSVNAMQSAYGGQSAQYHTGDAFVAKFSGSGVLLAMTYLGGSRDDNATSLAVDADGNVYVTGYTNSTDFPFTSRSYQPRMAGAGGNVLFTVGDAFVVKLNSSLSQITYSTCLGGVRDEAGIAIAIDRAGSAYVTGITLSTDFPTTPGAVQTSFRGSGGQPITDFNTPFFITGDVFVSKLSADGSQLVFSTYLGGTLDDAATSIAVDAANNVYVGGFTISRNFPTSPQALQTTYGGSEAQNEFYNLGDGFLAKLNPTGTALLYSTYLGGRGDDAVSGIAVDSSGSLYATGATTSTNFPVSTGAFRTSNAGPLFNDFAERIIGDGFAVKLRPDGSALSYGTFLGGSGDDSGKAIAIDATGNAYVAGNTASANFPLTADATQRTYAGAGGQHNNNDLMGDGFVAVLDPTGTREVFATLLGGSMDDGIHGIAVDSALNIYVTGTTMSPNFPTSTSAFQPRYGGAGSSGRVLGDAFVAKFGGSSPLTTTPASVSTSYAIGAARPASTTLAISASAATSFTVSTSASWASATPSSGQTPANLTVTVNPGGFATGTYNANITLTPPSGAPLSVPVVLTVTGSGALPVFSGASIVNSASSLAGAISPGEIITIYGVNMGPPAPGVSLELDSAGRVATTLGGTRVFFDGVPAPMTYSSTGQLSCVVPYSVADKSAALVQISYNGILSSLISAPVRPSAPGLYTLNQQGTGQASALNQDSSFNSAAAPAAPGSVVVLFGTGEGATVPVVPDGSVATDVIPAPILSVTATVAGRPATVQYGATAPNFVVGALQVNVLIPPDTPSGNAEVVVTVGGTSSRSGVTIAVR